jgi:hypothetical protein
MHFPNLFLAASAIITTALAATTAQGTVLYFNPVRDYGFITPDDGSAQVSLSRASFKVRSFPKKKRKEFKKKKSGLDTYRVVIPY